MVDGVEVDGRTARIIAALLQQRDEVEDPRTTRVTAHVGKRGSARLWVERQLPWTEPQELS